MLHKHFAFFTHPAVGPKNKDKGAWYFCFFSLFCSLKITAVGFPWLVLEVTCVTLTSKNAVFPPDQKPPAFTSISRRNSSLHCPMVGGEALLGRSCTLCWVERFGDFSLHHGVETHTCIPSSEKHQQFSTNSHLCRKYVLYLFGGGSRMLYVWA